MMITYPNFFIVGATKAGTTSVYQYLRQHPEIFLTPIKEPCFFCYAEKHVNFSNETSNFITDPNAYWQLFCPRANQTAIGECSTPYLFFFKKTIKNMYRLLPNAENLRIIIILRNPIDRAYSQYCMLRRDMRENLSFEESLEAEKNRIQENYHIDYFYTARGFYYEAVKSYLEHFNNVLILFYEDLKKHPQDFLKQIFDFLKVNSDIEMNTESIFNKSGIPKNTVAQKLIYRGNRIKTVAKLFVPVKARLQMKKWLLDHNLEKQPMEVKLRKKLYLLYQEDIKNLSMLLNIDLSSWR